MPYRLFPVAFLLVSVPLAQEGVPPTPAEADIPMPVPGEVGLAGQGRPDIERFLNVRSAGSPSLSPDGTRLAFRTSITGKPQLWVVDAAGGWPQQLTFGESITFHRWSPTGDVIVYGSDRGGNEREGFYLITPDGAQERELLPPSTAFRAFGGFSPDGTKIAYSTTERTGRDFDVHVFDLVSGKDREVFRGTFGFFVASWRPDGEALVLSETRGEDGNDLHLLDLRTGELKTLFSPTTSASYSGVAWEPNGGGFYLATDEGHEFRRLMYCDPDRPGRLTSIEDTANDVGSVALTMDGRFLSWSTNEGGYTRLHVRDLERGVDLPDERLPELPPGIFSMSWARGANVAAISGSGPRFPGDIWTWSPEGGETKRATYSATAGLDMAKMVVPTHHDFPARDGVTLHGLLYLPRDVAPDKKPPVLIGVHGGPTGQSRPRFNGVQQYLLARGIAIFELNFRGSTGYGKTFARLDNKRLRPNAVLDMEDCLAWLAKQGQVDTERAAVMGGSYGGYMTNAALTQLSELFDCGVSIVGVSNWITALEGASPALKASDRLEYGDIDDPEERAFFTELSPLTHVKNVKAPLMVMHGANDPRDPVEESDQFVRAIRENGGEVEYLRFPDEGHGVRKLKNRIIAYRRIAAFLERHLQVDAP